MYVRHPTGQQQHVVREGSVEAHTEKPGFPAHFHAKAICNEQFGPRWYGKTQPVFSDTLTMPLCRSCAAKAAV